MKKKEDKEMVSLQDGNYATSLWFEMFVSFIDYRWPGSGEWITAAAALIPWEKLQQAVINAIADWEEGKSFLQILKEALQEWVDVPNVGGPLAMTKKPESIA